MHLISDHHHSHRCHDRLRLSLAENKTIKQSKNFTFSSQNIKFIAEKPQIFKPT